MFITIAKKPMEKFFLKLIPSLFVKLLSPHLVCKGYSFDGQWQVPPFVGSLVSKDNMIKATVKSQFKKDLHIGGGVGNCDKKNADFIGCSSVCDILYFFVEEKLAKCKS